MTDGERIIKINIEEEMKSAYIDYSMSVIVARALPDVRDGLKPVHRRVLFGMSEQSILSNRPYKKSARIVGDVLGKYHPHGDSSVYEAMVRMAQPWSLRYPLVDGQGNFGSVDGDSPAAMRYTEARMQKITEETLADLDKDTVDFQLNFDDSLKEPTVLPTRVPILLVNGASGIAVGMATNMPPHNLSEVVDATIAYIDNKEIEIDELIQHVKAPDFPTGGLIYGYDGVKEAFNTGRGRVVIRAKTDIEMVNDREKIVVTEIPYLVNKAELIKKIAELVNEKKIEGISNVNDESDRHGMRIVVDLKRDAIANVVLNKLYKMTALQSSFSVNNIALVDGRPKTLNLKDLISSFVDFRHEVVVRRTKYDLDQAEKRAHILEGLLIALDHIDEVIALIRASRTVEDARNGLMEKFKLSEEQARAIVDMRLRSLAGLERDKIKEEYDQLMETIKYLRSVLEDESLRMNIIKDELAELKEKYGDERRTEIIYASEDFNPEDFYADDEVVITISRMGYIKRTPLTEYRTQARGGVGAKASSARDEDFLEHLYVATNHNTMLFFTEKGKCYWLKVYEIPEGTKASKGRAIQNMINIAPDDRVCAYVHARTLEEEGYIQNNYILLCTKNGQIKKTVLEAFSRPRQSGIAAITIREDDRLIIGKMTNGEHDVMMALKSGRAIRFHESKVRAMGRTASGVRGITLTRKGDEVIGLITIEDKEKESVLVVADKGYGKRSHVDEYRETNRGGKGVKTMNVSEKTGELCALKSVTDEHDLMIINRSGIAIRLGMSDIRVMGRATQGVRLINLRNGDAIAAVSQVPKSENGDEEKAENLADEAKSGPENTDNDENGKEIED